MVVSPVDVSDVKALAKTVSNAAEAVGDAVGAGRAVKTSAKLGGDAPSATPLFRGGKNLQLSKADVNEAAAGLIHPTESRRAFR